MLSTSSGQECPSTRHSPKLGSKRRSSSRLRELRLSSPEKRLRISATEGKEPAQREDGVGPSRRRRSLNDSSEDRGDRRDHERSPLSFPSPSVPPSNSTDIPITQQPSSSSSEKQVITEIDLASVSPTRSSSPPNTQGGRHTIETTDPELATRASHENLSRQPRRDLRRPRSSSPSQRQPRPISAGSPKWRTSPPSLSRALSHSAPIEAEGSNRSSSGHATSAPRSEPPGLPSPLPSFSLTSGQPLVNPPMKTQAAFVGKLYSMLDDEEIQATGLIHWSPDGTIFTCPNPSEFSKVVLPRFFKHNNWQSFVRQLNMYSKVSRTDRDGQSYRRIADTAQVNDIYATTTDPGAWEFRHPLFRRGQPHLLASIKRKTTRTQNTEDSQNIVSPTDEVEEQGSTMAGWMREVQSHQLTTSGHRDSKSKIRSSPPPPSRSPAARSGERPRDREFWHRASPQTHGTKVWGSSTRHPNWSRSDQGTTYGMPAPDGFARQRHFQHDPTRRSPSTHDYSLPVHTDSPSYPQPRHSQASPAAAQIIDLEHRIDRLSRAMTTEKVEHARSVIDLTSHLLKLTGWNGAGAAPSAPDLPNLRNFLHKANEDYRRRYDNLVGPSLHYPRGHGERRPSNHRLPSFHPVETRRQPDLSRSREAKEYHKHPPSIYQPHLSDRTAYWRLSPVDRELHHQSRIVHDRQTSPHSPASRPTPWSNSQGGLGSEITERSPKKEAKRVQDNKHRDEVTQVKGLSGLLN